MNFKYTHLLIYSLFILLAAGTASAQSTIFDASDVKTPFSTITPTGTATSTLYTTSTPIDEDRPEAMPTFIANPADTDIQSELSMDEISAEDLGINDPKKLPGEPGYWWENFKRRVRITFILNPEKKAQAILDEANIKILEAKKLSEKTNDPQAATRVTEALEKYRERIQDLKERLQALPENENVLQNLDKNFLAHEQLLRNLAAKLPGAQEQIDETRLQAAREWMQTNRARIKERLEKAIENSDGSKFKQLENLATIEELSESLPEVSTEVSEAGKQALLKLEKDLDNASPEDRDKIDAYLRRINTDEISKQRVMDRIDSVQLSTEIRARLEQIRSRELNNLKDRLESIDPDEKTRILKKLDSTAADPAAIELIEEIREALPEEDAQKIQAILEKKMEAIKQQIRSEINVDRLNNLENKLKELPALRMELRDRQLQINPEKSLFIPGPTATSTRNASSTIFEDDGRPVEKIPFRAQQAQ